MITENVWPAICAFLGKPIFILCVIWYQF